MTNTDQTDPFGEPTDAESDALWELVTNVVREHDPEVDVCDCGCGEVSDFTNPGALVDRIRAVVQPEFDKLRALADRVEEALVFVAARYNRDGSGANFRRGRCTGISSDALAWFAVGARGEPAEHEYPRDRGDLAACERTYDMAPDWLKKRMAPVLTRYREAVAKDYPELAAPDAVSTRAPVPASDDARQLVGEAHSGAQGDDLSNRWPCVCCGLRTAEDTGGYQLCDECTEEIEAEIGLEVDRG